MKIAIFETEHFEGAYPVIKLFDEPENSLTIITNKNTYPHFSDLFKNDIPKYNWAILDDQKSRFAFFRDLYKNIKEQEASIYYLNTISKNHLLYALIIFLLPKKRFVLTVHDINCLFESKPGFDLRQMVQHIGKKLLIRQIKEFNVVSDTMISYLQSKVSPSVKVHNIPGAFFEDEGKKHQPLNTVLRLAIPGSIDGKRRDYESVFNLLNLAETKKIPVHIILLGGHNDSYGFSVIERAKKKQSTQAYAKITCYDTETVQQDEFDAQLNATHFIFIPSVVNTKICSSIPETYGLSKSSGNIFDVIKHARPFIIPGTLTTPPDLESSCFRYDDFETLIAFFMKILSSPEEYKQREENAYLNSKKYTIEKIRSKNPALFKC